MWVLCESTYALLTESSDHASSMYETGNKSYLTLWWNRGRTQHPANVGINTLEKTKCCGILMNYDYQQICKKQRNKTKLKLNINLDASTVPSIARGRAPLLVKTQPQLHNRHQLYRFSLNIWAVHVSRAEISHQLGLYRGKTNFYPHIANDVISPIPNH